VKARDTVDWETPNSLAITPIVGTVSVPKESPSGLATRQNYQIMKRNVTRGLCNRLHEGVHEHWLPEGIVGTAAWLVLLLYFGLMYMTGRDMRHAQGCGW
jgi:hypothetical protein